MVKKRQFLTLGKKLVYENPWLKLHEYKIKRDGSESIYTVVERSDTVIIVPLSSKNDTILLKQYRYPVDGDSLEFPMGGVDDGETMEDAAARELLEETGLTSHSLEKVGEYYANPGLSSQKVLVFTAKVDDIAVENVVLQANVDEIQEIKKVSLDEVFDMAAKGIITDGFTLAALLFLKLHAKPL